MSETIYGIPVYLRAKAPDKRVISIAFVEVDKQKTEPQSYAPAYPDGRCHSITFGSLTASTTKTLVKSSNPSSIV